MSHTRTIVSADQRRLVSVFWLLTVLIGILEVDARADTCSGCKRTAFVPEISNAHAFDYESQNQAWNECMGKHVSKNIFDVSNPELQKALEACKSLEPSEETDYLYPSTVLSYLAGLLTSPCFHLQFSHSVENNLAKARKEGKKFWNQSDWKPPEYELVVNYDAEVEGEIIH